jgi:hypothetical protein
MSLVKIQNELKAPKSQFNAFGKYKYRNCEDILEALKPLLLKYNATLVVFDEIVLIGERYYVKATASFVCNNEGYFNTAYARESLDKKGMDDSQITGTASSYARKYALNGLFLIDDTKDADSMDNAKEETAPEKEWYNDFDKHKEKMIERINKGEAVEVIIESIESKYKLSKEVKSKIMGLKQ